MNERDAFDPNVPDSIAHDQDINSILTPEFIEELEFLNIAVDEYERLLQDSEPKVIITTSSTAGY